MQVHLVGAQRLVHRVLPGMLRRRRGDVVVRALEARADIERAVHDCPTRALSIVTDA